MREYESIFVLDPTVSDSHVDMELEKIREFLGTRECEITEVQKWGRRKLAYEVKKHKEGIYTLIRFSATADVPHELGRRYRLNENMLRFLTVVYEKPPVEEPKPGEERPAADSQEAGKAAPAAAATPAPAPAAGSASESSPAAPEPEAAPKPSASE
jgi:small subunit ribosomal protein S6